MTLDLVLAAAEAKKEVAGSDAALFVATAGALAGSILAPVAAVRKEPSSRADLLGFTAIFITSLAGAFGFWQAAADVSALAFVVGALFAALVLAVFAICERIKPEESEGDDRRR